MKIFSNENIKDFSFGKSPSVFVTAVFLISAKAVGVQLHSKDICDILVVGESSVSAVKKKLELFLLELYLGVTEFKPDCMSLLYTKLSSLLLR